MKSLLLATLWMVFRTIHIWKTEFLTTKRKLDTASAKQRQLVWEYLHHAKPRETLTNVRG